LNYTRIVGWTPLSGSCAMGRFSTAA